MRAQFDNEHKLDVLEFITESHEEYVPRQQVIDATRPTHNWMKEWNRVNTQDNKSSPEMSKKGKTRVFKSPSTAPPEMLQGFPHSGVVKDMGITETVAQFLEVGLQIAYSE